MSDDLSKLLREAFEYSMTDVHTVLPGVVVKYDPKTRRADIQPSLKRKMPGGKFMDFPIVPEVPVLFFGTKKYTIHVTLEKDDEVLLMVNERGTDTWKDNGGKGIEENDPRRFDLQDCFAIPGLQAVEFIPVEEEGLNIIHKSAYDGDLISSVSMDDNKVEVKYKEKSDFLIEDDHISGKTEKCSVDLKGDVAELKNSKSTFKLNSGKFSLNNGSKSLFTIWDTLLTKMGTTSPTTLGSPATHNWNPAIATAITTAQTDLGQLLEA